MDVQNQDIISPRKQAMRKSTRSIRPCSRRAKTQDCVANVNEAKREFSLALQLHKSSSSSSGTNSGYSNYNDQCYFDKPNYRVYSLMEPMPLPEPIWSTTQPSVLASNNSSLDNSKDLMDFEFFEAVDDDQDQASSYTWWVGFLKSLDGKITSSNVVEERFYKKHPIKEYYGCELEEETTNIVTPCVVDIFGASDNKSPFGTTDDWLSFPGTPEDEDHETTISISP